MRSLFIKRFLDIFLVISASPIWVPILVITALLVRICLGSPIFFVQPRPGRAGIIFNLIKFRTMLDTRGTDEKLLSDEIRLTPFGKWLRSTSLDELPELWNVLKGEMSLVGPRPLLAEYLQYYSPAQRRRHEVPPGLTGLAQIKGRNSLSWEEKFEWDLRYIAERDIWLDLRILAITVVQVLSRNGINAPGVATMPEFRGNDIKSK